MDIDEGELAIFQRLKDDFRHYTTRCLTIRTKRMELVPFELNRAQLHLHNLLEAQRTTTGRVRALILKGRQQGCTTYVQARFYWRVTHQRGARAFILTHEDEATQNVFGITKRYHDHCPTPVKPETGAASAKELSFSGLDSGYKVATAGTKETGRSSTIQFFHGSEVAFWPNADSHMAGAMQAVPDMLGTEVILESTSNGAQGLFYELARQAQAGQSDYQLIFIPWFWQEEYRKPVPEGWEPTAEEQDYAREFGIDDAQLVWRRGKILELNGLHVFRREYPATVDEAFMAEVPGALYTRDLIRRMRCTMDEVTPLLPMVEEVVAVDPAVTAGEKSNKTGIIAGARARNGVVYIFTDASQKTAPDQWARAVVDLYDQRQSDCVVYEGNQGGDLVAHTLQTVRKSLPLRAVWASRGKQPRAQPVQALAAKGLVKLVGPFPELENQMCTWVPGEESPDNFDAYNWLVTHLLVGNAGIAAPLSITSPNQWAI